MFMLASFHYQYSSVDLLCFDFLNRMVLSLKLGGGLYPTPGQNCPICKRRDQKAFFRLPGEELVLSSTP
jgi:hypothetical protein